MTQQIELLRQLWHNQPLQGHRFRAMIKADPYSRDDGRSLWLLANPTLAQSRTVIASHMWVKQDHSMTFSPPVGATISFNADVYPYTRTNGFTGFGLGNLRNVEVEAEAGVYVAGADYAIIGGNVAVEEFDLAASEPLLEDFDLADIASGRLEQSIAAGAKSRTGKLTQRILFNERIASLAVLQEEVTGQFLQLWQQAQAAAAELARLEVEIADDPELEEERYDLQQLAGRQREMAAAYWHWQPPHLTAEEVSVEAATPTALIVPISPEDIEPEITAPPVIEVTKEQAEAEAEAARAALRQMIADTLKAEHPDTPIAAAISARQKAPKRPPKPPTTLKPAPPANLPPPADQPTITDLSIPVTTIEDGQPDALAPAPDVEASTAEDLLGDEELLTGKLDEIEPEGRDDSEPSNSSPAVAPKRAQDIRVWHEQIVAQVWHLVQRKQPHDGRIAPYSLAQIKDGRRRETDHLKLIGLKAIVELLALVGERPTSKELGNRYLGYDLPKGWSPSKLTQKKLPLEDERAREEIVNEVSVAMLIGA